MDVGVLYSGGKDSTLAALLLEPFYDVTVVCCTFGVTDEYQHAMDAAARVDLPAQSIELGREIAETAATQIVEDGYPRNGIQYVHEKVLEAVAEQTSFDAIADGTRRDDRVPTVGRPLAQSVEDRFDVSYLSPLAGYGRQAIDALVEELLLVESGPSDEIPKGDYETEIRALLTEKHSSELVEEVFPEHYQSRVLNRK